MKFGFWFGLWFLPNGLGVGCPSYHHSRIMMKWIVRVPLKNLSRRLEDVMDC